MFFKYVWKFSRITFKNGASNMFGNYPQKPLSLLSKYFLNTFAHSAKNTLNALNKIK